MLFPIKVVDIELSQPIPTLEGLDHYMGVQGLVRLHGVPLGYVKAPVSLGRCTAATLGKLILEQHSWAIISQLLKNGLTAPERPEDLTLEGLIDLPPVEPMTDWPLVTVAVCTRDRPEDMKLCLEAISQLDYPHLEVLVIDNAPATEGTKDLVDAHYPQVRYVREPRPGLDWARNRAILEAKGEIIAYTDDDVAVDPGWVKGLARVFAENPEVMAVTGLVVPYELEHKSQVLFEDYGGFGRGFETKWYSKQGQKLPWQWFGAGQFGTGANMSYRRAVFESIGFFNPALDVGTVTNGGGDLEMFVRVLKAGYPLVYEPTAMIRHRHRQEYEKLQRQISYNGVGLYAYFECLSDLYPDEVSSLLYIRLWWIGWWHLRRILISYIHPQHFPRDLIWAEFIGVFQHFGRYQQACRNAKAIQQQYPSEPTAPSWCPSSSLLESRLAHLKHTAIRTIDLSQPILPIEDVSDYQNTRLFALYHGQMLGYVDIKNAGHNLSRTRLAEAIAPTLGLKRFEASEQLSSELTWGRINALVESRWGQKDPPVIDALPDTVSISIVVATLDRPDDLRRCLTSLTTQISPRPIEIVVVDNNPSSHLTAPVVAEFPRVKLVQETRKGLSYARNAGIIASCGEIIVTTDDDVSMPSHWLETLVQPFKREDVMVVTGNVLPVQLETMSQNFFETYGGLGRGFQPFEANGKWFEACAYRTVPTWDLGATANAAFRASIFRNPNIGLIDEALGAGTPTGCSEDTYIFYKVLKLNYTIVYEPHAFVWHRHRDTLEAFRKQIFNYSKGHVAYHLTTLLNDGDLRVFARLFVGLPLIHARRIYYRLRGWTEYPISFVLLEIWGNLSGPWVLWRSRQRAKRLGRSQFSDAQEVNPSLLESTPSPVSNQALTADSAKH
jgi:GT2 family glycosyltransferase